MALKKSYSPAGSTQSTKESAEESAEESYVCQGRNAEGFALLNQALLDSERRYLATLQEKQIYQSLFQSTGDAILLMDEAGIFEYNHAAATLFNAAETAPLSHHQIEDVMPATARFSPWVTRALRQGDQRFEWTFCRLDGVCFPAEVLLIPIKRNSVNNTLLDSKNDHHVFQVVIRDITHRKQAEEALIKAVAESKVAAEAKATFLSTMSHEIRTPLNGVLGMASLLFRTDLGQKQKGYLAIIERSGKTLLTLINDILDYSKMGAGKMQLHLQPFSVRQSAQDVLDLLLPLADEKALDLRLDNQLRDDDLLLGDDHRLRQILTNLVGNAIKFTAKGGVTVRLQHSETAAGVTENPQVNRPLHIEVCDTGIGIDEQAQSQLFQSFTQADNSVARQYGGTGLGLAICKELVNLMDSEIGVKSVAGKGTTFWFDLLLPFVNMKKSKPEAAENKPSKAFSGTVLLVDDIAVNQMVADVLLQDLGLNVILADNGQEAIDEWQKQVPEIVLMDRYMPVMDGIQATQKIRELERLQGMKETPIIALTATDNQNDIDECMASGMNAVLCKPFDAADITSIFDCYVPKQNINTNTNVGKQN